MVIQNIFFYLSKVFTEMLCDVIAVKVFEGSNCKKCRERGKNSFGKRTRSLRDAKNAGELCVPPSRLRKPHGSEKFGRTSQNKALPVVAPSEPNGVEQMLFKFEPRLKMQGLAYSLQRGILHNQPEFRQEQHSDNS